MPKTSPHQASETVQLAALRTEMLQRFAQWPSFEGPQATVLPWLKLVQRTEESLPNTHLYEPSLVVTLQGGKRVLLGSERHDYDESRFLLTSVDLPVMSCVASASVARPFVAMVLKLELAKVRQWVLEHDIPEPKVASLTQGMTTGPMTVPLLSACARLLALLDAPEDLPVLADLLQREIVYRLLRSEQGGRLWQNAMTGSQSHRILKAIHWLRHHHAEPLQLEALADMAAMSLSSLHHHFREITSMSPLQFQKQLRLQEARRLMLVEELDAGSAAFQVGYESPSQFSREYRRLFGQPPLRDIKHLRGSELPLDANPEGARSA